MRTSIKRVLLVFLFAVVVLPLTAQQKHKSNSKVSANMSLPRAESSATIDKAVDDFLAATKAAKQEIHSIMVVQNGEVIAERWLNGGAPDKPHVLNSVSKTFTATAVGFAINLFKSNGSTHCPIICKNTTLLSCCKINFKNCKPDIEICLLFGIRSSINNNYSLRNFGS